MHWSSRSGRPTGQDRPRRFASDEFILASGRSLLAQLITVPVTAVAGLVSIRLLVSGIGPAGYGSVVLITSLPALLPFADLGLGAWLVDNTTRSKSDVLAAFGRSFRLLLRNSVLFCVAAAAIGAAGIWHLMLGFPANGQLERGATIGMSLFALSVPLSLGYSLALGAGRNHSAVYLRAIAPVANVVVLSLAVAAGCDPCWYVVILMLTPLPGAVLACRLAARALDLGTRDLIRACRVPSGQPVARSFAGGMLVIMLALPVTYQTDRIVISHVLGSDAVARYSAMAALYGTALGLVNAAGLTLWPQFARRRREGRSAFLDLRRMTFIFAAFTAPMAAALVFLAPWVTTVMTHGQAPAGRGLAAAFGLLLLVIGTHLPCGMFLTDARGLGLQAWGCTLMALTSVVLSIALCGAMGPAGPVLASSIAFLACVWPVTAIGIRGAWVRETDQRAVGQSECQVGGVGLPSARRADANSFTGFRGGVGQ